MDKGIRVVGIDPGGKGGAVSMLNGEIIGRRRADDDTEFTDWLAKQFTSTEDGYVYVEKQSGGTAFAGNTKRLINYGRLLQQIDSVTSKRGVEVVEVAPATWRKFSVKPWISDLAKKALNTKEQARFAAIRTLDEKTCERWLSNKTGGNLHDGLVDAALIALYGHKEANERRLRNE